VTIHPDATPRSGVLEHLDPATLQLEANVRDNATAGREFTDFVENISQYGVLVPVLAVRTDDGTIIVREGQRRTLAAREAGLATIPVYVVAETATTDQARTVARITEQIVTNDRRLSLTEAQRAKGIQQLLMEGVSATKVAKSLTIPKAMVAAAAVAVQSESAMEALGANQLTIEQAARLAEFDSDPEAAEYLCAATSSGDFDHRVSELRQKALTAAAWEAAAHTLREKGFDVLDERPDWSSDLAANSRIRLCDTSGETADVSLCEQRPELWAVWLEETAIFRNIATGEEVDEQDVDWDIDEADVDAVPEDGYLHPKLIAEETGFEPEFYCLEVDRAGLMTRTAYYQQSRPAGADGAPLTNDERIEVERREKRKVLALNKLGKAAIEVRQSWIKDRLLARKTPPKGAAVFIAEQLSQHPALLAGSRASATARQLLGLSDGQPLVHAVNTAAGDPRATVVTLGLVIGALEAETPKDAWRFTFGNYSKVLLTFLEDNGYELSSIEKVLTGQMTADTLYDTITADPARDGEDVDNEN